SDPSHTITITNNEFAIDTTRNVAVAFDSQVGGPQIDVSNNQFEDPGTAPGAVRVYDFLNHLSGTQDYSGVTGNHVVSGGQTLSNETGTPAVTFGRVARRYRHPRG